MLATGLGMALILISHDLGVISQNADHMLVMYGGSVVESGPTEAVFATAPFSGYGTSPQGASIDIVDEAGMAELGEALRTDSMDTYLDVFVTP